MLPWVANVGKITFGKHLKPFYICFDILGLFQVSLDATHILKILKVVKTDTFFSLNTFPVEHRALKSWLKNCMKMWYQVLFCSCLKNNNCVINI